MQQLFYVSNATDQLNGAEGIQEILNTARNHNAAEGISGLLLYKSGIFIQLLEGEESKVEKLFFKIEQDPRHANVTTLFSVSGNSRIFEDWSMAYREVNDMDIKLINEVLSWNKLMNAAKDIDNNLILHMLTRFKEKL